MNIDEMKAEFLSFAIEAYKTKLGVSGAKVAGFPQLSQAYRNAYG